MDERARTLLRALIERYIADGEPVGSRTLAKHAGLELSPASIRNVMADLEEQGFITSPHTSAGRIPTARGYRFFVDTLMVTQPLSAVEIDEARASLVGHQRQELVASAARLLAQLSSFAGVVAVPYKTPAFRHIEFVRLGERRVLMVLVTPDGDVQNRFLTLDRPLSQSALSEAANYFNEHFADTPIDQVRTRLADELRQLREDITTLVKATLEAGSELARSDPVVIAGERHLLSTPDFTSDMERLRKLFDLFEERTRLMRLFELACQADGVKIFIGGESNVVPLEELSVVTAPFQVNGQVLGTLGVIGPTRMAYDRVIPIVDMTARLLSSALEREIGPA
ncbi:MAG: heat-inducible transcriptional repressor HrcA [Casimicrobiaceae bacterium]|nr:heat-inducible transcriptional repressor HrcA [Casimicrobiaceae bacterium]MCX8098820.1 heat-inducible transcriptional repressor HrcA [Casimicrobiaceae bacterium]MDW8311527.1 heat-inducible transcriptional repressor HrcA [Burkholderiales bacterium]